MQLYICTRCPTRVTREANVAELVPENGAAYESAVLRMESPPRQLEEHLCPDDNIKFHEFRAELFMLAQDKEIKQHAQDTAAMTTH